MTWLLDTNVISEVRKSTGHPHVRAWMARQAPQELYLSAISVLEIQRGIAQTIQRGDVRQAEVITRWLQGRVLPAFAGRIVAMDHLIAQQAGNLPWPDARDFRDAVIAATALALRAAVVTRNVRHFEGAGVELVNPWEFSVKEN